MHSVNLRFNIVTKRIIQYWHIKQNIMVQYFGNAEKTYAQETDQKSHSKSGFKGQYLNI